MTKQLIRIFALACAVCLLIACRAPRSDFSYLNAPTVYELAGEVDGLAFRATLSGAGRDTQGEHLRDGQDFLLVYHEPPALRGISVAYSAASDVYTVRLGELEVDGEVYAALGEVGRMMLTERAVERREDNGSRVRIVGAEGVVLEVDATDGRLMGVKWRRGESRVIG